MSYLNGLSGFAVYFSMGIGFIALYVLLYLRVTPYREIELVKDGNMAAAIAFAGALLGFALPLASALMHTVDAIDLAIWAGIAFVSQWIAFIVTRLLIRGFASHIEAGNSAVALFSAVVHVAVGLSNAAAMSY